MLLYFVCNAFLAVFVFELGIEIPGLYGEQLVMTMLEEVPLLVWSDYVLVLLLTGIIGPFVEEIIYRGFVTDILMKEFAGR
ncbi:MAG: hypothetical protein H6765_05675 [Candidatus Peribacteria bacterium]|nr:MAG: hypothetical protein H6765_05675 [Candidatus Peribacteria bacterium]